MAWFISIQWKFEHQLDSINQFGGFLDLDFQMATGMFEVGKFKFKNGLFSNHGQHIRVILNNRKYTKISGNSRFPCQIIYS